MTAAPRNENTLSSEGSVSFKRRPLTALSVELPVDARQLSAGGLTHRADAGVVASVRPADRRRPDRIAVAVAARRADARRAATVDRRRTSGAVAAAAGDARVAAPGREHVARRRHAEGSGDDDDNDDEMRRRGAMTDSALQTTDRNNTVN